jgi:hypothetical protein
MTETRRAGQEERTAMFNISFDKGVLAFLTGIGGAMMRESNQSLLPREMIMWLLVAS